MKPVGLTTLTGQHTTTVVACRSLARSAFILSLDRQGMDFTPGQCVILGLAGHREQREYSIYSPLGAETLDVLIRRVEDGVVSRQLHSLRTGDRVQIEGPVGFFTLADEDLQHDRFLFVASGTGIAPFHCMVGSYPGFDYQVLHGVRHADEGFGADLFDPRRRVLCTSRDAGGDFAGRVTDYLRQHPVAGTPTCCLCGNVRMIDDVHDLLTAQGVPAERIRAEVYF